MHLVKKSILHVIALAPLMAASIPAYAQGISDVSASLELASDERRRGLSWSDGDPVIRGAITVPIADGLQFEGTAVSLWNSVRHGGADAVIDIGGSYSREVGAWRFSAEARYHLFPGASGQGYGEIGAGGGFIFGPATVELFGSYAPRQSAIGGDNLYVSASSSIGVPGTPLTLSGHVGRSTGSVRDPIQSLRLRPAGSYWDHSIGLEYVQRQWFTSLRYSDTDIDAPNSEHAGSTVVGKIGLRF